VMPNACNYNQAKRKRRSGDRVLLRFYRSDLEHSSKVGLVEIRKGVALLGYKDESQVLVKDQPSATFEMLLKKAEQDGRLTGKHRCSVCGMRYKREKEASTCCYGIAK